MRHAAIASIIGAESESMRPPTSTTTPANPISIPATLLRESGSASQIAAAAAPKNGLVAFRIAPREALMYSSAKENSENGNAELRIPITRKSRQLALKSRAGIRAIAIVTSTAAASVTRTNASGTGPSAGTA